jgi:CXXC-20-CXXC protein
VAQLLSLAVIRDVMKTCPHCGSKIQVWRVWQSATVYRCPSCDKDSAIALESRLFFAFLVPVPTIFLAVGLLAYLDIRSWLARILIIIPLAFAGSFLMKYCLARFGRFKVLDKMT